MLARILFLVCILGVSSLNAQVKYERVLKLMGTRFELAAISPSEEESKRAVEAGIGEIQRIEKLISSWDQESQTSAINQAAGVKPVKVDKELYDLIYRSEKLSGLTDGAFDISFASIDNIWKFDGSMTHMPEVNTIAFATRLINYHNIQLNLADTSVFLKTKGMKIGFGAIGKGYAANRAKKVMQEMGIKNGLVNASGDLITWGKMDGNKDWAIGISKPENPEEVIAWLSIGDMAVVTSGSYEKYVELEGHRYSHIIDPRTGYPATGLKSVTIICPDAELADGLATSVFVMGPEAGLNLINKLNGIEGILVTDKDEMLTSENLKLNYYQAGESKRDVIER